MRYETRTTDGEYEHFLKAARLRLMSSQGACSTYHPGLLAASIKGLMTERIVSPETRKRLERTVNSMTTCVD